MPVKKYNNVKRKERPDSNIEIIGIVLVLISAFLLLCIVIPVFMWDVSRAIKNVVIGLLGFSAYPIFLSTLLLGIAFIQNLKVAAPARYIVCVIFAFISVLFILQLATTHTYLSADFYTYISTVYKSVTAGGVIFGVLAYGIQMAITPIISYVLFGVVLACIAAYLIFSLVGKRKESAQVVVASRKQQFVKSGTAPKAVMPVKDSSLFVSTIIPTKYQAEMKSGSFDELDDGFPGEKATYSSQGDTSNSANSISSDEAKRKEDARKILFGDNKKYSQNPYDYLSYNDGKADSPQNNILSQQGYPTASSYTSPNYSLEPNITPIKAKDNNIVKPPKYVHDDSKAVNFSVPMPPPKDVSNQYVEGSIVNGDYESQKIKEEQMEKHTEATTPESAKPANRTLPPIYTTPKSSFDVRKIEPISIKQKPEYINPMPEPAQIPNRTQGETPDVSLPPITNGDYFANSEPKSASQINNTEVQQDKEDDYFGATFLTTSKEKDDDFIAEKTRTENYNNSIATDKIAEVKQSSDSAEDRFSLLFAEEKSKKKEQINNERSAPKTNLSEDNSYSYPNNTSPIINADFFGADDGALANQDYVNEKESDNGSSKVDIANNYSNDTINNGRSDENNTNENNTNGNNTNKDSLNNSFSSSLRMLDGVEDLSERSFDVAEDHTGYYNEVSDNNSADSLDEGAMLDFEARVKSLEKLTSPKREENAPNNFAVKPIKAESQLKIDDIIPAAAVVPQKPKKKKAGKYVPPSIDFLITNDETPPESYTAECEEKARLLEKTLKGLKLPATVIAITRGPAVTRYELEMPHGIPIKRIEQFSTDIEYYLASNGKIRIETPIPGKRAVGIEVPNQIIDVVGLRDIIASKEFNSSSSPLTLALGKDIAGTIMVCNLEKMPHLLIAGATGSGKSACLNSIIISILYKASPEEVRIMLIDPKHVEFTIYKDMPHLLTKEIITDAQQAINAFKWAKAEMERRYIMFSKHYNRNIQEYNKCDAVKDGTESKLPFIVIIVDELAELMMSNNRKELEDKIMSMAQKARAAGIHLILATQRPSVDVITGTIKANLPSRIAFAVKSSVDSRTILDQMGAETLLGRGDMLYAPLDADDPRRVQGAYVTNEEVATVVDFVKDNNPCDFDDEIDEAIAVREEVEETAPEEEESEFDTLMPQVLKSVILSGTASTSMIQRRFAVGYARASRIIDQMEIHKFISPLEGSKPRAVYISPQQFKELFGEDI